MTEPFPDSLVLLSGSKTLDFGPAGTGKTDALLTYIEAGLALRVLFTEPGGHESLLDSAQRRQLSLDNVHWRYVSPATSDLSALVDVAKKVNLSSYESLTKDYKGGIGKMDHQQWIEMLEALRDFRCDCCGLSHGSVDSWGPEIAFALDSASGLNLMAKDLVVGARPVLHEGEWGVAMSLEEKLIQTLCCSCRCFFTLIAHVERGYDAILQTYILNVGLLGQKLAPKIPRWFSDVVYSYREAGSFYWATDKSGADLKFRTLPSSDKLVPSYVPVVEGWKRRNEASRRGAALHSEPTT